ncbi:M20/M25/M40 family metallo-hydrolase [Dankookia sp. P2]|uniref:M20/M25/M40 family metallo-hydrolase n=1 Tax=Dankookia sp. P2 TaxID=3423955 RepID=UPI003D66D50D
MRCAPRRPAPASPLTSPRKAGRPSVPVDHPLIRLAADLTGQSPRTAPYGTDASELQDLAPCVILGPGTIETAHTPHECVAMADLAAAVPLFARDPDRRIHLTARPPQAPGL